MSEKQLVKDFLKRLRHHRRVAWVMRYSVAHSMTFTPNGGRFKIGNAGVSDIIGQLKDGRFLAVEVKVAPNKATEKQQQFLDQVNRNRGVGLVAYSFVDVEKMLRMLS
jgi:hypothetical protein